MFFQISNKIKDTSSNHGVGRDWTYTQYNLDSDKYIELTVMAMNDWGYNSKYQSPGITFHTAGKIS